MLRLLRLACLGGALVSTGFSVVGQTVPISDNDFMPFDDKAAAVGQLLFYDPILSGNRNISCATCHHHDLASSDGVSLGIGEGGQGLGVKRTPGIGADQINKRVPRNAPPLWNVGAKELRFMFHDGRVSKSNIFGNKFNTPVDRALPDDLISLLAAQALLPILSEVEMAGSPDENDVARAKSRRPQEAWDTLAARIAAIEEYDEKLRSVYPETTADGIEISHIANAIASFLNAEFRSFDSPYDAYISGDSAALNPQQLNGMALFFGDANCANCHSGQLFTDHDFHALALPAFGPGRTRGFDPTLRDAGRLNETNKIEDAYKFRTPMLRNVALTGPYGHNGAYASLEGIIRHHLDPLAALDSWTADQTILPDVPWLSDVDFLASEDSAENARLRRQVDIEVVDLSDTEVAELVAFLQSLTGRDSIKGRLGRPETVPSGLSVD